MRWPFYIDWEVWARRARRWWAMNKEEAQCTVAIAIGIALLWVVFLVFGIDPGRWGR